MFFGIELMSSRAQQRTNLKNASAISMRQAMNKRRHDLSSKIRKTKKSQQLQLKRSHTEIQKHHTDDSLTPVDYLIQFTASPTIFTLASLQSSIASSKKEALLPLNEIDLEQANLLLKYLLKCLSSQNKEECLQSLRVLTNLAAIESPDSYYGSRKSWCHFMLTNGLWEAISPLISSSNESIKEQTGWVIGNIAGDSSTCRNLLVSFKVITALINCLRTSQNFGVIRNTLWCLGNIARGIDTAIPFIEGGMNSHDILNVLCLGENVTQGSISTWDIKKELVWLLSFLTCKENDAISVLVNEAVLLQLSNHFAYTTKTVLEKRDRGSIFKSAIPVIRIFGNIATASDGKFIPLIIEGDKHVFVKTLIQWFQVHKPCGETMAIATECTWVAGSLLCDNGFADHPSTTVACPLLVPPLCHILLKGTFTLEWKREVLNAIWNALAAPPDSNPEETIEVRDHLLGQIYREKGMIRSLVGMLVSLDVDAIRPAINMLDAMHRRMSRYDDNALRILREAECEHALETVCDSATSNASYGGGSEWQQSEGGMDYCAEMAANLIDDFYGDDDDGMENSASAFEPSSKSGSFEFGFSGPTPSFNFSNTGSNDSGFNSVTSDPMGSPNGRSKGRGRGRSLPSWMQNKR